MRTPADLIAELNSEAASGQFQVVALVVRLKGGTDFVKNRDGEKLKKLKRLIRQGGEPIGFIAIELKTPDTPRRPGGLTPVQMLVRTRPLHECADSPEAHEHLASAAATFQRTFQQQTIGKTHGKE